MSVIFFATLNLNSISNSIDAELVLFLKAQPSYT